MMYLGDFAAGATVEFNWNAFSGLGGSITRATDGSLRVYKGHSITQRSSAAGITDTEDFDALTGLNHVQIDLSDNTDAGFYAAGSEYSVVLQGAVIDGQTVNAALAHFSIARATAFLGTPAGASLAADIAAIKALLPTALVSGRMDSSVGAMAASVLTATAINNDAITAAKIADGAIDAATFAAGAINAAAIAPDAIGASELAADAATEIGTAVWAATTRVLTANTNLNDLSAAAVRAAVGLASANLDTQLDALPTNAELATALGTADDAVLAAIAALNNLSAAGVRAAVGLASANLDTQLDALPTNAELATALATADDAVLAAIAALNNLSAAQVNAEADTALADAGVTSVRLARLDADVSSRLASGSYSAPPSAATVASAVRTELTTELGRVDAAISTRSTYAGGDTSGVTTLLARLTAIRAGLLDNLDAAMSSRMATFAYTAPPSAAAIASQVRTELGVELGRVDAAVSTRLAGASYTAPDNAAISAIGVLATAINLKTVNLPADPASAGDFDAVIDAIAALPAAPSAASVASAVFSTAIETGITFLQHARYQAAVTYGPATGLSGAAPAYKDPTGAVTRVTAALAAGARSSVTLNSAGP